MRINGYPRLSEIVSNGNTVYNRNSTQIKSTAQVNTTMIEQLATMLGCKIAVVGDAVWENMDKDATTLYIVTGTESISIYYGELPLDGGGGGGGGVLVGDAVCVTEGLVGFVATATKVE